MHAFTKTFAASLLVSIAVLAGFAPEAAAQSASDEEIATSILKFDTEKVSQKVTDAFYSELDEQVEAQEEMTVMAGSQPTIEKILLAVGCEEPNTKCLSGLSSYVDGDRIIFGSIKRSQNVYLFSLKMFDFTEGRFIRRTPDQTIEGEPETVRAAIPAVVESFLHGDVGTLDVSVQGAAEPRVRFDGQKMGPAPTTLENLPLGQHAVTVRTADGEKKQEFVLLRQGETASVSFNFGKRMAGGGGEQTGGGASEGRFGDAFIPGVAVAGAGVAGIVVGAIGQSMRGSQEAKANKLLGEGGGYLQNQRDISAAKDARTKYKTGTALAIVGYSVGAAGLAAGGYLIYRGLTASPAEQKKTAARRAGGDSSSIELRGVRLAPSPDGVSAGVSLGF